MTDFHDSLDAALARTGSAAGDDIDLAPCTCGSDATSLNPAEVVVHRRDGQPCYIARIARGAR